MTKNKIVPDEVATDKSTHTEANMVAAEVVNSHWMAIRYHLKLIENMNLLLREGELWNKEAVTADIAAQESLWRIKDWCKEHPVLKGGK